jgi:multicomponent Na+:H+ antiporter subunit D
LLIAGVGVSGARSPAWPAAAGHGGAGAGVGPAARRGGGEGGAFGIVRIDEIGIEFAQSLNLLRRWPSWRPPHLPSFRALFQDDLKRRLAFSTVSQVSYIALGVALFGPAGTIGGLVHLVHQGIMKITLFFCAGNYAETLGIRWVSEMDGAGRRMPLTTLAFSIGALGMMGAPLTAGAVSKAWLTDGATAAGMAWAIPVLWASSLLNAAYFLPILWRAWFHLAGRRLARGAHPRRGWRETAWLLLLPPLLTAAATLAAAAWPMRPLSPLAWARLIAARNTSGSKRHETREAFRQPAGPVGA